ncbi:MAG TPA: group I intron-associated PD-(D/E)XK endonuclease [Candidatus Omnitrophota bacterium]|nr:group I intron-associated PD-(D/E)XK endonuclease [Candidatus Omnitrophota bacterium]
MHHTKTKADIGVAKVIGDLAIKGYVPCIPLSEHQPYDIVAVSKDGCSYKLQVKYASLKANGTIDVSFRTSWADKNGTHIRHYAKKDFDYYALYCAEKDIVLYVPNDPGCPKAIRFEKAANNQNHSVKWANDYLKLERESSETTRCTPETVKT